MKTLVLPFALFVVLASMTSQAAVMNYNLEWTGGTNGYYGKGIFSYDDTSIGVDNLVTLDELDSFIFSIFDDSDTLSYEFNLAELATRSVFTFETLTGLVQQAPGGYGRMILTEDNNGGLPHFMGGSGCGDYNAYYVYFGYCPNPPQEKSRDGVVTASAEVPTPATLPLIVLALAGLLSFRVR